MLFAEGSMVGWESGDYIVSGMSWALLFIRGCLGLLIFIGRGIGDSDYRWSIYRGWSIVNKVGMVDIRGWGGEGIWLW